MKLTISKKGLKDALVNLSKIVSSRASLPILGCVKISGEKDGVKVTGTNLEQTLTCKIKGGEGGGSFIVDLKELKDYLKQGGTTATVQFEDVGNKIAAIFHAGNIPVIKQFSQFPLDEWPELAEVYYRGYKSDILFAKIYDAASSASKDSTRRVLQSVLLESDAVIASNGKELVKLSCTTGIKKAVPIPVTKFLRSANFAKCSGTVAVQEVNGVTHCRLESDNWIYTTKCVDGNYPNYRQVIPKSSSNIVDLSGKDIEYLKKGVPLLDCDDEHNTIHLYADHRQVKILPADYKGTALTVNSKYIGVKPVVVSLNRELLVKALNLGFGKLEFADVDNFAPITARGHGGDLFVLMPLRVDNRERIINAVNSDQKRAVSQEFTPGRSFLREVAVKNKTIRSTQSTAQETVHTRHKKEEHMSEERKRPPVFQVVGEVKKDPFEELLNTIAETRCKAKELFDVTSRLTKGVKDAQRAAKAKEREFKSTRDLLGKLKKVSGF
jgi:DNA polymerase-3 subunit beta